MMCIADLLARAVPGTVVALRDVQVKGFVAFDPERVACGATLERRSANVDLFVVKSLRLGDAGDSADRSDGVEVASGRVETGSLGAPAVPASVGCGAGGRALPDPYASGSLFHGPAFQLMQRGEITRSRCLDRCWTPGPEACRSARLHPALLDAALHGIPHDQSAAIGRRRSATDKVSVSGPDPRARRSTLRFRSAGEVRCEVRFDGYLVQSPICPASGSSWAAPTASSRNSCSSRLVFPKGALGIRDCRSPRRAFLRDREFVEGVSRSRDSADGETRLCAVRGRGQ